MKHENDRTPGKYDVIEGAKDLVAHTLKVTANESKFPKRYRFTVVAKIINASLYILDKLLMAQELYPENKKELKERILYQKKARAKCRSMMTLLTVLKEVFGIGAGSFEYWIKMISELRNHITAWIMSDKERFGYLLDKNKNGA